MTKIDNGCQLVRCNPSFGNIKIVVDETSMWMDSLTDVGILAHSDFRNVKLRADGVYCNDVGSYLDGVQTSEAFDVMSVKSIDSVGKTADEQLYRHYESGVSIQKSKNYGGTLKAFAPLYIDSKLPEYFVIFSMPDSHEIDYAEVVNGSKINGRYTSKSGFKINGVTYQANEVVTISESTDNWSVEGSPLLMVGDPSKFTTYEKMIANCKIIKSFDLTTHPIGEYLQNHINSETYIHNPLNVEFDNKKLTYHGISIDLGSMGYTEELIPEKYFNDNPIHEFDEFVMSGYSRNRLVSANAINLEFIFDDDVNEPLSINRYFGLYLNYDEVCRCGVDLSNSSEFRKLSSISPRIPINGGPEINDELGVKIGVKLTDNTTGFIPNDYDLNSFYASRSNRNLRLINASDSDIKSIRLKNKSIKSTEVYDFGILQTNPAEQSKSDGYSSFIFSINQEFEFNYGHEIIIELGQKTIKLIADKLPNVEGFQSGDSLEHFFHPDNPNKSMVGAINNVLSEYKISCLLLDDVIIIRSFDNYDFGAISMSGPADSITIIQDYVGVSKRENRLIIPNEYMTDINIGDYVMSGDYYVKIESITPNFDNPVYNSLGDIESYESYDEYSIITTSESVGITSKSVVILNDPMLSIGMLDIFPVRDYRFSTEAERYTGYDQEYKRYYNSNHKIQSGVTYRLVVTKNVVGSNFSYNGVPLSDLDTFEGVLMVLSVEGVEGNFVVINTDYESDSEILDFGGFYKPGVIKPLPEELKSYYEFLSINGDEYDRLLENEDPSYAFDNKLNPSNNQWRMISGNDARNNPYRLNISMGMGVNNFSPSFDIVGQDPGAFTHEWYFLAGQPKFPNLNASNQSFYLNRPSFDKVAYVEGVEDYFTDYLSIRSYDYLDLLSNEFVSKDTPNRNAYSLIEIDNAGRFCTFFRGVLLKFDSDTNLDGWKFSCILQMTKSKQFSRQKPVEYTQYENHDHKNVLLIIDVIMDDYKIIDGQNVYHEYSYLYMMKDIKTKTADGYRFGSAFQYPPPAVNRLELDENQSEIATSNIFYGVELYNKSLAFNSNDSTHLAFNNYIPLSQLVIANSDGEFPRLMSMDAMKFIAMTSENGDVANGHILNEPSTILSFIEENTVKLADNGIFVSQIPSGEMGLSFNPSYVKSTIYPQMSNSFWYIADGGEGYYSKISQLLSAANILENLGNNEDGLLTKIKIEGGLKNESTLLIIPIKPNKVELSSQSKSKITRLDGDAYEIWRSSINKKTSIYRYSGNYMPMMYDVIEMSGKNIDKNAEPIGSNSTSMVWYSQKRGLWVTNTDKVWVTNKQLDVGSITIKTNRSFINGNFNFLVGGEILHSWARKISKKDDYLPSDKNKNLGYPQTNYSLFKKYNHILSNNFSSEILRDFNQIGVVDFNGYELTDQKSWLSSIINIPSGLTMIVNTIEVVESTDRLLINMPIRELLIDRLKPDLISTLADLNLDDNTIIKLLNGIIDNLIIDKIIIKSLVVDTNNNSMDISIYEDGDIGLIKKGFKNTKELNIDQNSINPINVVKSYIKINPGKLYKFNIKIIIKN